MASHTPGPWVIDDRSLYDGQNGLGMAPVSLGAVVAECPTAFGSHTIRAPHTIGKPCQTKEAMDAEGLANAHLVKAAPELLHALQEVSWAFCLLVAASGDFSELNAKAMDLANAAIASAEGRS